jgi:phosphoribosylformylglycinamidine synthase
LKPKICILRTDGTNCDRETAFAFNQVGGDAEIVHINSLKRKYDPVQQKKISLDDYHILAIPGGFSHGDYIAAGKVLAQDMKQYLGDEIQTFVEKGKPIIGICNGFQVLVKSRFLPGESQEQTTTLTYNDSQRFECRWVKLKSADNNCIWTQGIDAIDLPVAHGEGKFLASEDVIKQLFEKKMVVFQYVNEYGKPTMEFHQNPNGSLEAVAGICDPTGRIFGLMPHPERYNHPHNHHLASLQRILARDYVNLSAPSVVQRLMAAGEYPTEGHGLKIFRNGVNYAIDNLLE